MENQNNSALDSSYYQSLMTSEQKTVTKNIRRGKISMKWQFIHGTAHISCFALVFHMRVFCLIKSLKLETQRE